MEKFDRWDESLEGFPEDHRQPRGATFERASLGLRWRLLVDMVAHRAALQTNLDGANIGVSQMFPPERRATLFAIGTGQDRYSE